MPSSTEVPYDEWRQPDGRLRPQWEAYFKYIEQLGDDEAKSRWTNVKSRLQENGVSYNVYDESKGSNRPWRLSPIPLILGSHEWDFISRAIEQRAQLLSSILTDLYGPQRILMDGDLPCELVFDNPKFLRALHGLGQQRINWLPLFATDLVRAPSGEFQFLEDHTQSPAGMGYALENRVVVAQFMPDVLRVCNVERLVTFFRVLGDRLRDLAPHNRDAPRVALLSPGPLSATYFEQAYLAQHLGITLVQGEDLTVRNDRVYLKTLGGLQPIDVLLRRVFDDYCDPLELRADSSLGVPGLVQAVRAGNVSTFNPLGTGLLGTPAFIPFLPGLCQKLLHQDLLMPSVPTYYCGVQAQRDLALADFDNMVVKPTFPSGHSDSIFVRQLALAERATLKARILQNPSQYVAQKFVPCSRTPVISNRVIHSRSYVLRCFATCSHPRDYHVMPGGLALVASADEDLAVSMYRGARSKDVWVVSDEPVPVGSIAPSAEVTVRLSRGGGDLPSRVADNLYWLGRYTERAESLGRLSRVIGNRFLDVRGERDWAKNSEYVSLLSALHLQARCLAVTEATTPDFVTQEASEREFVSCITDPAIPGAVVSTIQAARRVSRVVRDRLSYDTWRILASLDESAERLCKVRSNSDFPLVLGELNQVIASLAGFSGLAMESMTRGLAWRFLDMGRRIERSINLVTFLRVTLINRSDRETQLLEAVLEVADSSMTYRRRYPNSPQLAPAADLLLADDSNPRGLAFQLRTLTEHIGALPQLGAQGVRSNQQRLMLSATNQLDLSDIDELCRPSGNPVQREGLKKLLEHLGTVLPALSDSLTEAYLYHASVARHLQQREGPAMSHLEAVV